MHVSILATNWVAHHNGTRANSCSLVACPKIRLLWTAIIEKATEIDHAIHSTPSSTQTIDQNNAAKRSIKTALHKSSQPHQLLHLQGDVEAPSCTAAQFLISEVVLVLSISTAQANTSHAPSLCTPAQYNKGAQAANTVSKGVLIR